MTWIFTMPTAAARLTWPLCTSPLIYFGCNITYFTAPVQISYIQRSFQILRPCTEYQSTITPSQWIRSCSRWCVLYCKYFQHTTNDSIINILWGWPLAAVRVTSPFSKQVYDIVINMLEKFTVHIIRTISSKERCTGNISSINQWPHHEEISASVRFKEWFLSAPKVIVDFCHDIWYRTRLRGTVCYTQTEVGWGTW